MPTKAGKEIDELRGLLAEVKALRDDIESRGTELRAEWGATAEKATSRALNLSHYIALRGHDLTDLQYRLVARGLSSLGRSEARVAPSLDALIATLRRLTGDASAPYPAAVARPGASELDAEADRMFGKRPKGAPRVRVMATLPPEAATQPELVDNLVAAGMDCARINCAHDDAEAWSRMIANVREAGGRLERPCKVLMDIAGPKCRILKVKAPPKTRLQRGDRVVIVDELREKTKEPIAFSLNFPELVDQLAIGAEVFIDDGKAAARVVSKTLRPSGDRGLCRAGEGRAAEAGQGDQFPVDRARPAAADLEGFPRPRLRRRACRPYRLFLRAAGRRCRAPPGPSRRARARSASRTAIVLKIETPLAVRNLPSLILQAAAHNPTAVMIARGDLAVELGFARLTEMQEEILWLCEAAHTPVVWATQVLDNYVRDGLASRAEMTDAAMAQGADCVMLNKGPYLAEGVAFLRDVLARMDRHFAKKFARFGSLKEWS